MFNETFWNVAQSIKLDLRENHPNVLERFKVNLKDREYQIFKRNALSVDLFTRPVIEQKLDYVHNNPVKAGICTNPEDYRFSSARYYLTGKDEFSFLSNIFEWKGQVVCLLVKRHNRGGLGKNIKN